LNYSIRLNWNHPVADIVNCKVLIDNDLELIEVYYGSELVFTI